MTEDLSERGSRSLIEWVRALAQPTRGSIALTRQGYKDLMAYLYAIGVKHPGNCLVPPRAEQPTSVKANVICFWVRQMLVSKGVEL